MPPQTKLDIIKRYKEAAKGLDRPHFSKAEIVRTYESGKSIRQTAKDLGCSRSLVQKHITDVGAKRRPAGHPKPVEARTTHTKTMVRKSLWLDHLGAKALRKRAFDEGRSESDLLREALERFLESG